MPRLLAALFLAALLPEAARAQVPIQRGPLAPVSPPIATSVHGITVTGSATARIAATSARVELSLATADRRLTLDAAALQPVVDALVKAGADPGSVQLPPNFAAPGYSNNATIGATFTKPTVPEMQSGIVSVGTVVAAQKNLVLTSAQVQLWASGCSSAIDGVRHDAVRNAHAKAASLASDLGVHVGAAIDVRAGDQIAPDGTCTTQYYLNGFGGGFNPAQPQSPNDYVTVPITSTVTITYAIK